MKFSYFTSVWSTKPERSISAAEVAEIIASSELQVRTEAYRRYISKEMTKDAENMKKSMPGVTIAGQCRGKRDAKHIAQLSALAVYDFDDTNERTAEIKARLKALPYVMHCWTSISGVGLKATVRIDAENVRQYAVAYSVVARKLGAEVDFACDMNCRDLARYCSLVYDPEVYFNPDAEVFPWRKEGEEQMLMEEEEERRKESLRGVYGNAMQKGEGKGVIAAFLDDFLRKNAFVKGQRHELILKLGRCARSKNFSARDMDELKVMSCERLAENDFSVTEIEKTLSSGYQYVCDNPLPPYKPDFTFNGQRSPKSSCSIGNEVLNGDDLSIKSNELRAAMPYFPDEVYEAIPEFLKRAMVGAHSRREKDMLLMGVLVHLSACLPRVSFLYHQREYSPHFYFAGVANSGTGKGVVTLASYLSAPLCENYRLLGKKVQKAYEEDLEEWNLATAAARKKGRKPDYSNKPEEPEKVCLCMPANTSKTRVYKHLHDNGELGGIIHASEINTLASAIGQDFGKFDDVFCAAFQHEDLASSFKVDGEPVMVTNPKLALCMTGTPDQFVSLVHSQENGLYSRLALLTAESTHEWHSAKPEAGAGDLRSYYRSLGKELIEMHKMLLESPTSVQFTDSQWAEHTLCCSNLLKAIVAQGEELSDGIAYRIGLIFSRLATILTALRKCEDKMYGAHDYVCTDVDFRTAEQIIMVLIEHSLLLSSSLPEMGVKSKPLKDFYSYQPSLDLMGDEFKFCEFIEKGSGAFHWSQSTGQRLLHRALNDGVIVHQGNSYKKVKK